MLQGLKKAINLIRLIPTVLTCAMLVFYATYLGLNIKNGIGDENVNIVFLIVTVISLVIQILLYFRVISSGTPRKLKRACRVTKILTNILALFVALYTSSVASSFMSILMLPIWFAQLAVEIIAAIIERRIAKKMNIKDIGLFLLDPLHIGQDVAMLIKKLSKNK